MPYTWTFGRAFAAEFKNLPEQDQNKILEFTDIFEVQGLRGQFAAYPGKIAPSWSGGCTQEDFKFARDNSLWHYHIGIPEYEQVHSQYKTSEYLLHFQWEGRGDHIRIVDLYAHYRADGKFYLPSGEYLEL